MWSGDDQFRFYEQMGKSWQGKVDGWEMMLNEKLNESWLI